MVKYSKYKGVTFLDYNPSKGKTAKMVWQAQYVMPNGKLWSSRHETEREAALAYDKKMLELGKEPVNILKRKQ